MATDKRLDQVSQLTDFDYALIVKGDQVAKASKQQLAELVGNLLYGATNASSLATVVAGFTSNIGNKLNGTKITDLDTLRTAGIYTFSSASDITVGLPPISDKSLMMLVTVTSYTGTANTLEYMQTAICGGVTYCREFYSNSWKDWKNLSNFGYNSLEELSAGVAEQNHITIGSNAGLRVSYNKTYDTSYYPAAHGSVLRVGDNTQSGIGFELFFGYGGGLWNKNEGESTWKKIL